MNCCFCMVEACKYQNQIMRSSSRRPGRPGDRLPASYTREALALLAVFPILSAVVASQRASSS
jgi:hypothetical protein